MVAIVGTPAVSQITATSAVVTWTTDVAADSQVEYGLTSAYGSASALDPAGVTAHSRTLTGLTPGTTYHLRVRSAETTSFTSDPAGISGIAARWRVNDLAGLSANDPVGVFVSGIGGLVAQQPLASQRPVYVPNAQNGKAGLQFDGISDHLNAGDVLKFTGAFTAQFVLKLTDTNPFSMIFTKSVDQAGTASATQYEVRRDNATNHLQFAAYPGGTGASAASGDTTLTGYHVWSLVVDPTGAIQWYLDGAASGSPAAPSPGGPLTDTTLDFVIGDRLLPGTTTPQLFAAPMVLLELNLYSVALDASTRHGSELFLGAFYGLSVA